MPINPVGINIGDILYNPNRSSSLNTDFASGVSSVTVYGITDFAINQILLIGELGSDGSEIIKTHGSTAPSGNTVTLLSATVKAHAKDTKVYVIEYDQIEFYHSVTATGSKTQIGSATTINPNNLEPIFNDTTYTSGYYFFRFKNSLSSAVSEYTDPIPYAGFSYDTVGYVMTRALSETGSQYSEKLTSQMLIDWLNDMLRFVRGKLKRWSRYQAFDEVLGQVTLGSNKVAMPTNAYDQNSFKAVDQIRISGEERMSYIDKKEFDERMENIYNTTVATQPSVGDTSLVLTSSADFSETGSVDVYYSGTKHSVTYTANDQSTGTLSGIPASGTGSITATFAVASQVWQNASEGTPTEFTIFGGYVYFPTLPSSTLVNRSYLMDYYTDIPVVDSEGDTLVGPRMDMALHWLKWNIKAFQESNGTPSMQHPEFMMFMLILNDAKRTETHGQKFKQGIKINGIFYNSNQGDFDRI